MKITGMEIYLISKLDDIRVTATVGVLLSLAAIPLSILLLCMAYDRDGLTWDRIRRVLRICLPVAAVCLVINLFLPSTWDMLAIKMIPPVVNSKLVQDDIPEVLRTFIRQYINKHAPEAKEQKDRRNMPGPEDI